MVLAYRPSRGQVGIPHYVQTFAFAPWAQPVRVGDVLGISAGGARWQGPPRITGLSSRSGRMGAAAEYLIAGDETQPDPALIRALAAGGKVRLARQTKDGSRIKGVVDLPRPPALGKAYQAARTQAAAALGNCPPPTVSPVSAP
jgi:hypothetical protein